MLVTKALVDKSRMTAGEMLQDASSPPSKKTVVSEKAAIQLTVGADERHTLCRRTEEVRLHFAARHS